MKIAVSAEGRSFSERGLYLDWPRGGGKRKTETVSDDKSKWSVRLRREFERGHVVELTGPAAATETDNGDPFASMNYDQVKAESAARGLPTRGKKADQIAAIKAFDGEKAKAEAEAAAAATAEAEATAESTSEQTTTQEDPEVQ